MSKNSTMMTNILKLSLRCTFKVGNFTWSSRYCSTHSSCILYISWCLHISCSSYSNFNNWLFKRCNYILCFSAGKKNLQLLNILLHTDQFFLILKRWSSYFVPLSSILKSFCVSASWTLACCASSFSEAYLSSSSTWASNLTFSLGNTKFFSTSLSQFSYRF